MQNCFEVKKNAYWIESNPKKFSTTNENSKSSESVGAWFKKVVEWIWSLVGSNPVSANPNWIFRSRVWFTGTGDVLALAQVLRIAAGLTAVK